MNSLSERTPLRVDPDPAGLPDLRSPGPAQLQIRPIKCHGFAADSEAAAATRARKKGAQFKLGVAVFLSVLTMGMEAFGGLYFHSVALLADAVHMLADTVSYLFAFQALRMSMRTATTRYTFGFGRLEVLGSLASTFLLWGAMGAIVYEATTRLTAGKDEKMDGRWVLITAGVGLVMNYIMYAVLRGTGHGHSHGGLGGGAHGHSHGDDDDDGDGEGGNKHGHNEHALCGHDAHDDGIRGQAAHGHAHADASTNAHGHGHGHGHGHARAPDAHGHGHAHAHAHAHARAPDAHGHGHGERGRQDAHGHSHSHEDHGADAHEHTHAHKHAAPCGHGESSGGDDVHEHDMTTRAAIIHVLSDMVQNLLVMAVGGVVWWKPHLQYLDSIVSFIFAFMVVVSTTRLVRDIYVVLMEAAPAHIDTSNLRNDIEAVPGVLDAHCLHVWSISPDQHSVAAHILIDAGVSAAKVLEQTRAICSSNYDLYHTHIQISDNDLCQ